jgi:hypothetical protein
VGNHVGDLLSSGAVVLSLLGKLLGFLGDGITYAGALAGLTWFCIQIWRSREIQHWWHNRQEVKRARRLVRLRARERVLVAKIEALAKVRAARVEARDLVEQAKVDAAAQAAHETVTLETGEGTGDVNTKV